MKKSARLLMTTDCVGGVWRYSITLAGMLQRRGWRVGLGVVGPSPSARHRSEAEAADIELVDTGLPPLDWEAGGTVAVNHARAKLRRAAGSWGADIVHVNQPAYCGPCWSTPVVAALHSCVESWWREVKGGPAPEAWGWHRDAVKSGLQHADVALAPSRSFAHAATAIYDTKQPVHVVYNGAADAVSMTPQARHPAVLAAGRLWDEGKNMAALNAAAGFIDWPVYVAGSRARNNNEIKFESLRYLGELDITAMRRAQKGAAIFVSPSLYEPFGLAVLEAALSGAALALSDIPTFRELWGDAASYFDPKSPRSIAAVINELIRDEGLRNGMAARSRRRAVRFNIGKQADHMEAIYLALVSSSTLALEATV